MLCVDEKSQVQALDRSQPVLPMMPGMPERRTHDYARHGVTSLFAAFNIADGTVISELHRRHRHQEYLKFLKRIDKNVPAELGRPCGLRQLRHPQDPRHPGLAGPPPPLPRPSRPESLISWQLMLGVGVISARCQPPGQRVLIGVPLSIGCGNTVVRVR